MDILIEQVIEGESQYTNLKLNNGKKVRVSLAAYPCSRQSSKEISTSIPITERACLGDFAS